MHLELVEFGVGCAPSCPTEDGHHFGMELLHSLSDEDAIIAEYICG